MSAIPSKVIDAIKETDFKLPTKGDSIQILKGKHKGKSGTIFWSNPHGKNHYGARYGSSTENCIADACGASLRLGVETESGERFFVNYYDHCKS